MNLKKLFRDALPDDFGNDVAHVNPRPYVVEKDEPHLATYGQEERAEDTRWHQSYIGGTAFNWFSARGNGSFPFPRAYDDDTPYRRKCLYCGSNVEGHDNCPRCGAPEN